MIRTCWPGGRGRGFQMGCALNKGIMSKSTVCAGDLVLCLRVIRDEAGK